MFAAYHQMCQPTTSSSTVSTSRRADALPRLEASTWPAKEDLDTTGGRGSRVHNRLTVVIGAGSLVVEVAIRPRWSGAAVSERVYTQIFNFCDHFLAPFRGLYLPNAWSQTLQTSKRYTFRVSAFHWYHWFGIKLFPVGCAQDSRRYPKNAKNAVFWIWL